MRILLFYAFLVMGLLLDGAALFRVALLCAVLHEAGHVAVYIGCAKKLPRLVCSAGGIKLCRTAALSGAQRTAVLLAGPAANFITAALLYASAQQKAAYSLYFIAAVNVCVGAVNLLPFGALDGAQLIELYLPVKALNQWETAQKWMLAFFCVAIPLCMWLTTDTIQLRIAGVVLPFYLCLQKNLS